MGIKWHLSLVSAALAVVLTVPSVVRGQASEPEEPVFDLGSGIAPPKVVHQVSPKPDSGSRGFRISGAVLIGLVVSSHGLPVNVHVVHSIDKEIDQSAVEAVQEWRFEPGLKDGKPVAVRITVEIRFHDL
jgi:TonB family protein